jgi:hypothetical protein
MSLRHNTLWNLAASGLPLIAAAALIPFMLHRLAMVTQIEAFGVLTFIWALIGYFSLFDMGVGRTLGYELSKLRAKPADDGSHNETSLTLRVKPGLQIKLSHSTAPCKLTTFWQIVGDINTAK